jgi:methionyl-tRNA formyltransferase
LIDFSKTVEDVHNHVRGLSPFPGAYTLLQEKKLKIFQTSKEPSSMATIPGSIETDGKTFLKIACKNGYVHILDLQEEGKKRMKTEDYLRGKRF